MAKSYWSEDRFVNAVIKGDCINVMHHMALHRISGTVLFHSINCGQNIGASLNLMVR